MNAITVPLIGDGDGLPKQDWAQILMHHDRYYRDVQAHQAWAVLAKKCIEYLEGKQWGESDLRKLQKEGRPALTINKIRPLVNLALGYHLNNQTDRKAMAGNDGTGNADMARLISQEFKNISDENEVKFIDAEVFLDGIAGGRGYWDTRMDFDRNVFGEIRPRAQDPFALLLDADGEAYDLNYSNRVTRTDWISIDEAEVYYGTAAAQRLRPLAQYGVSSSVWSSSPYMTGDENISPARTFAQAEDWPDGWARFRDQSQNWVDTYRKTVRRLDIQHYVRTRSAYFVDMETGDLQRVPDEWDTDRINKVLAWSQQNGIQMEIMRRPGRRLRWTHIIGDCIAFDRWSPQEKFTYTPFFPYFRRGMTQGMIHPLLDPQDEINTRRSARINQIGRAANGGWIWEEGALTPQQEKNLEDNGGKPGFKLKWKRTRPEMTEPRQIQPAQSPVAISELEHEAANDLQEISGINKAALGQIDQAAASGRAIQARTQSAVLGLELFNSNWHRSVKLTGELWLHLMQTFYRSPRLIRVAGINQMNAVETMVNIRTAEGIINDITVGRYAITIGETSLMESFLAGQFQELLQMVQMGMPIPDDMLIDASSIGRKEEVRMQVAAARQQLGQPPFAMQPQGGGGAAPGAGAPQTTPPQPPGPPGPPQPQP